MNTLDIRKKLAYYIHVADDKKIKAVYTLLEEEIVRTIDSNIQLYNKELEEAEAEFANSDFISNAAMKKQVMQW